MASHLYNLLVSSLVDVDRVDNSKLLAVFSSLKSTIEVEQRFSETRCHKVMQLAENAYQDNLPEHYTEGVHEEQVSFSLCNGLVILNIVVVLYVLWYCMSCSTVYTVVLYVLWYCMYCGTICTVVLYVL